METQSPRELIEVLTVAVVAVALMGTTITQVFLSAGTTGGVAAIPQDAQVAKQSVVRQGYGAQPYGVSKYGTAP